MELANLAYTILAGLVAVGFFLGRLSSKVDTLSKANDDRRHDLGEIYRKLDQLAQLAAANSAYHAAAEHRRTNPEAR